jgi:anti-anti-sigma factor
MSDSTFVKVTPVVGGVAAEILCEKVAGREAPIVQQELIAAASDHGWKLIVDLARVTLLASVGLGGLVTLNRTCHANGGKMVVCSIGKELDALLKLTRLDKVLTIVADRPAAIKVLS